MNAEKTMETLAVGIALAALGGLTALAYRNPKQYRRLHPWLTAGLFAVILAAGGYTFGLSSALTALLPLIDPQKADQVSKALASITPRYWMVGMSLALLIYLQFLLWLDLILGPGKQTKDE